MTKSNLNQIKKGDKLSMTYYLTVNDVDYKNEEIDVTDQNGIQFSIAGKKLIEDSINTANQFTSTVKLNRTELVEKLENAGDTVFTVVFAKQANEETVAEALGKLSVNVLTDPKSLKKHLKDILTGEQRTLTGYLLASEPKMGRSKVVDLNVKDSNNTRLVDHRSIESIIFKNVKYVVK